MAGDWIKWQKGLAKKPEVLRIAQQLGVSRHAAAGLLMEFWEWADDNADVVPIMSGSQPDNCPGTVRIGSAPDASFDAMFGIVGLFQAMKSVGWVEHDGDMLTLKNFGRHNGNPAKARALDASRKNASRAVSTVPVQILSGFDPDKPRTEAGPEKRREEKRNTEDPPHPPMGAELAKPSKPRKPLQQPATVPIPPAIDTPEFRRVWTAWIAERTRQRKTLTESAAESQLASLAGIGTASAIECVQASITNQWQGLFPKKYQSDANKGFPTHDQKLIDVFNTVELPEEN